MTYKPDTDVVEEVFRFLLARELSGRGLRVVAYDLAGSRNWRLALGDQVRVASTAEECIEQADAVVLATPWTAFAEIPAEKWARNSPPGMVTDCWRALQHLKARPGISYLPLGRGEAEPARLHKSVGHNVP